MLSSLVNSFTRRVPGVTHTVVTSPDGLLLAASDALPTDRAEQLAAVTSGLHSMGLGAARLLDGDDVTQTIVEMVHGYLIVMSISGDAIVAVLVARSSDVNQVGFELARLAQEAVEWVGPPERRAS